MERLYFLELQKHRPLHGCYDANLIIVEEDIAVEGHLQVGSSQFYLDLPEQTSWNMMLYSVNVSTSDMILI